MALGDNQEIRRTLQNLLPGTTYATRVRALNEFGQYSDWSEAMEFTAAATGAASYDLIAPPAPVIQSMINSVMIVMSYVGIIDGISAYTLEHSLDNVTFSTIASTQIGLYIHTVSPGTTHYYRFTVTDIYGTESPVSPSNSGNSISSFSFKPYATVVVAASNSDAEGKENADFLCDGVNDEIQLAAAATAADGGTVVLLEGTYFISGPINVACNWRGQGFGGTIVSLAASNVGALFVGELFENIHIDGNGNDQNQVVVSVTNINNCHFQDTVTTALQYAAGNTSNVIFDNITGTDPALLASTNVMGSYFVDCTKGIQTSEASASIVGNVFSDCPTGIDVQHSNVSITSNTFDTCTKSIYNGTGATENLTITGNSFRQVTLGISPGHVAIDDMVGDSLVSGNTFVRCGINATGTLSHYSGNRFVLEAYDRAVSIHSTAGNISFVGNRIHHDSSVGTPGIPPIRIDNSTTDALITNNVVDVYAGTGPFSDAGITTSYGAGNFINGDWERADGSVPGTSKVALMHGGGRNIYVQGDPPTPENVNDVWIDTTP